MRVLAVDTATSSCSVAITDDDQLLSEITLVSGETHSRHLASLIEVLMQTAGLALEQIEGFAVTRGPGSFTGLRIGISTVKGLAVAGDRPMAGVSTLEALAWQVGPTDHMICPMIDARRSEVYAAFYRWHPDGPASVSAERVAAPETVLAAIEQPCTFIGSGAAAYRDRIVASIGPRALFVPASLNSIRAAAVAVLGARRLSAGDSDDIERFVPTYLRKSDAELQRAAPKVDSV
jgi:tRNA threonylcarbamoyladenosine biosynthesis protein TsaB